MLDRVVAVRGKRAPKTETYSIIEMDEWLEAQAKGALTTLRARLLRTGTAQCARASSAITVGELRDWLAEIRPGTSPFDGGPRASSGAMYVSRARSAVTLFLEHKGVDAKVRRHAGPVFGGGDPWIAGFAIALAEVHRRLSGGNDSSGICEVARNAGITLARAKAAGVEDYDLRELKKAGVR